MDILGIVSALAPDHVAHVPHTQLEGAGTDVQVQCGCSVRLTFLATEIAKLEPATKAAIAFQVGMRGAVSASTSPSVTNEGSE